MPSRSEHTKGPWVAVRRGDRWDVDGRHHEGLRDGDLCVDLLLLLGLADELLVLFL